MRDGNRLIVKAMYVCTLESLDAIGKANWIVKAMYVCTLDFLDGIDI